MALCACTLKPQKECSAVALQMRSFCSTLLLHPTLLQQPCWPTITISKHRTLVTVAWLQQVVSSTPRSAWQSWLSIPTSTQLMHDVVLPSTCARSLPLQRRKSVEPLYNQLPGTQLYIGGWPEQAAWLPPVKPAVLDVTCELPRTYMDTAYLVLPTWDTQGEDMSTTSQQRLHALHLNPNIMTVLASGPDQQQHMPTERTPAALLAAMRPCIDTMLGCGCLCTARCCTQPPTRSRYRRALTGHKSSSQQAPLCTSTVHTGMAGVRPSWQRC